MFPCLYRDPLTHTRGHEPSASGPSQSPWRARAAACPGPECGQVLAVTVARQFTRVRPDKRGVAGAQPHRWSLAFLWVLTQLASAPQPLPSPHRRGARRPRQAVALSVTTAYDQSQDGLGALGQQGRTALPPPLARGSEGVPHSFALLIPEESIRRGCCARPRVTASSVGLFPRRVTRTARSPRHTVSRSTGQERTVASPPGGFVVTHVLCFRSRRLPAPPCPTWRACTWFAGPCGTPCPKPARARWRCPCGAGRSPTPRTVWSIRRPQPA